MAIEIGSPAVSGSTKFTQTYTWLNMTGPSSASGIIDTVEIYCEAGYDLVDCFVGIFYKTNGNTLKCRSAVEIGAVGGGAKRTFPELSLAVEVGDYIGLYYSDGGIRYRNDAGDGIWHGGATGNHCVVDDEFEYTVLAGTYSLSLYGTGTEAGEGYYHGLKVQGEGELALCDVGSHPLRIRKGGTTYGIELVATGDPNASRIRIKTPSGIKAIRKYT